MLLSLSLSFFVGHCIFMAVWFFYYFSINKNNTLNYQPLKLSWQISVLVMDVKSYLVAVTHKCFCCDWFLDAVWLVSGEMSVRLNESSELRSNNKIEKEKKNRLLQCTTTTTTTDKQILLAHMIFINLLRRSVPKINPFLKKFWRHSRTLNRQFGDRSKWWNRRQTFFYTPTVHTHTHTQHKHTQTRHIILCTVWQQINCESTQKMHTSIIYSQFIVVFFFFITFVYIFFCVSCVFFSPLILLMRTVIIRIDWRKRDIHSLTHIHAMKQHPDIQKSSRSYMILIIEEFKTINSLLGLQMFCLILSPLIVNVCVTLSHFTFIRCDC